ncbi:hypothetical protein [Granulicella arctica]|uniref:Uncharacterized protein n=1 Tax=Granulicella arctica TaxID=940613 RepID=A0A7Y9PIS3_9BACT|nr:hypothetical protein [Granulicella arctica]NYF79863.1 hypothetical protein [Granulicella arctica]
MAFPAFFLPTLPAQETARLILPDAPQPQGESNWNDTMGMQISSSQQDQQPTASADKSQRPLTDAEKKKLSEDQLDQELHQRMAGVVPNFNAVLGGTAVPLSPKQKMRAAFRSAIDPYQFGLAFVTSGYGQATDSHSSIDPDGFRHGYGQGWSGFGKRYGASFADQFDGTIIGNGILPILLHQDARYYRMGTGSFSKRFFYSLSTTVRCKGDNGKWQPNYSNVLGNIAAGGISNLYYPAADRGFGLTIEQGMTVTAEGAFGALLIEFYPDIRKHIHGKRSPADPTVQPK